jgi:hypothetical protein
VDALVGESTDINIAGKSTSALAGGVPAAIDTKEAQKKIIISKIGRAARRQAEKLPGIVAKAGVKGAMKGLGWAGFVPDAMIFYKGFKRGYMASID